MKPLYIRMQAFGSYQEAEIDFASVQNGLFLITGDTGAGKTTIFDAITFALFGEASGDSRQATMLRSKYAGAEDPTGVELVFTHGDNYYEVRCEKPLCMRKYLACWNNFKAAEKSMNA